MANIKFTNFARSTLAVGINNSATTIALAAGTGARFPALVSGEYFYLTLENASLAREIVKVTARTVDSLTVVRAQDNTTAASWSAGDVAALRWNAATIIDILANVSASGVATPEYATAIEGQTLFMLTLYEYRAGTGNLGVYVNGLFMRKDVDYTETSNTSVTFTSGLTAGDEVCFLIGKFVTDAVDSAAVVYEPAGTGAVSTTVQAKLRESVSVKDFGAVGDGVADDTAAIWDAIISLRDNAVTIFDTIGGNNITAYSSGTVYFPPGIYRIAADQLKIYQDVGLTLKGSGSRRTNNSVRAATTLLISGTSSGFGIQAYRSGGRGLTLEDMDICYETSAFTGSVLDVVDAPGVTATRCFFGTYGITGGTRLQTAAACVRSTYDEFLTFDKCVFDGAEIGWWSDDTRTELANTFGGSLTKFDSCVFYDFADNQIYHGGTRTRTGLVIMNTAFNPISVAPTSTCLNIDNVEGLELTGSGFAASVSSAPAVQWLRATNCTGNIHGNFIDDLSPAGQVGGMLDISGNRFASTTGLTTLSGTITGKANEFSAGTSGWIIAPTGDLSFDLGPDLFKAPVTNSYYIAADSAFLSGRINYASNNDASSARFTNASARVTISNIDNKAFAVSTTPYTLLISDTGRTVLATGGSNQAFTLPTPVQGTTLEIAKLSGVNLVVTCAGGTNYYGQNSSALTVATLTGAAMGTLTLEAYGVVGWIVKSQVGTWVYS